MKSKAKSTAFLGMCVSLALVLAYVEILVPPIITAAPGIKMGLPNIIIIFMLYKRGVGSAIAVSFLRILLVSVLFGNVMSLSYSLAGGILSLAVMIILKKTDFLSPIGVSVAGGVAHNIGQILMAMLLLQTKELGYYMIILTVTGIVSGAIIGLGGYWLQKRVKLNIK